MKIVGITAEFRVEDLGSTVGAVAFQKLRLRSDLRLLRAAFTVRVVRAFRGNEVIRYLAL